MTLIKAAALVLVSIFIGNSQFAKASDADSRPIQANYQKLQLYEKIMRGELPPPLPLPDEPGDGPQEPAPPAPQPRPPSHPPRPPKPPSSCDPRQNISCIRAVCDQLPNMNCSSDQKVKDIACQCDGVNGECVTAVCNQLDRFDCDEKRELFAVTKICRGVYDARCIDRICGQLGRFECDDMNDMRRVTELCR